MGSTALKMQGILLCLLILASCRDLRVVQPPPSSPPQQQQGQQQQQQEASEVPIPAPECPMRGFNYVCWWHDCFEDPTEISESLQAMKDLGANWVEIVPTWYQEKATSNVIFAHRDKSPTLSGIRFIITEALAAGFKVALKPHLDVLDGTFRGKIQPTNLDAWHTSYKSFILTFAALAEEMGAEVFSIGTELKSRSGDEAFWNSLIPQVRARFDGRLTYAANWDEYPLVPFWDLVDLIGVDFYFPLADDSTPTVAELEAALQSIREDLKSFSEAQGKSFLFTEIGYRSVDGVTIKPYAADNIKILDLQEQADAYQAVLNTFEGQDWLDGIFWWRIKAELDGGSTDLGYSPWGKPSGDLLQTTWTSSDCLSN